MAVIIPITGLTTNNKRTGATFYASRGQSMLRSTAVPIQPGTFTQATAQTNFATTAQLWAGPYAQYQSEWGNGPNQTSGYSFFQLVNNYVINWGLTALTIPPPIYTGNLEPLYPIAALIDGNSFQLQLECLSTPPWPTSYGAPYWYIYVDIGPWGPITTSELSGVTPIGVPTYIGYRYVGKVGPFTPDTPIVVDWTDLVRGLFGQLPEPLVAGPQPYQNTGSGLTLQIVTADVDGNPVYSEYVEEPSPTPSYYIVPYTFGPMVGTTLTPATSAQRSRRSKAPPAHFYPSRHVMAAINASRAIRGQGALRYPCRLDTAQ